MKKIVLFVLFTNFLYGCGTLDDWLQAYDNKGWISNKNKKEVLIGIYTCGKYYYNGQDNEVAKVLIDAMNNYQQIDQQRNYFFHNQQEKYNFQDSTKLLIEEIYRRYNCLKGAEGTQYHAQLRELFGDQSCTKNKLIQKYVKTSSTLNVRAYPNGKVIGYLKNGDKVNIIDSKDEPWVKINVSGKVRDRDRIDVGYVHGSFLEK